MEMPEILYKYRDYGNEFHKKVLFEQEIFLSSYSKFNDPYDGSLPLKYIESDLKEDTIFLKMYQMAKAEHPKWDDTKLHSYVFEAQKKDLLHDEEHLQKEHKRLREDMARSVGVLSLTEDPMNYLMWSHYASNHSGFVIGFDTDLLFDEIGGALTNVSYGDDFPTIPLFNNIFEFHSALFATKSAIWKYEKEYRFTKTDCANTTAKINKNVIKEIYFGCNISLKSTDEILNFLKSDMKHCKAFALNLDKQKFGLTKLQVF